MTDENVDNLEEVFHSEAIYGAVSRKPLVKIRFRGEEAMITTDEARQLGKDIIDTAHASDSDAFIFEWLQNKLKADINTAAQILLEFRTWRIERGQVTGDA